MENDPLPLGSGSCISQQNKEEGIRVRRYTMLRKLRKALGLTQKQIEMIIGISQSAYSLIETGRLFPTYDQIKRLQGFFGMPIAALLRFTDEKPDEAGAGQFGKFIPELKQLVELDRNFIACIGEAGALESLRSDFHHQLDWGLVGRQLKSARRKNLMKIRRLESQIVEAVLRGH